MKNVCKISIRAEFPVDPTDFESVTELAKQTSGIKAYLEKIGFLNVDLTSKFVAVRDPKGAAGVQPGPAVDGGLGLGDKSKAA